MDSLHPAACRMTERLVLPAEHADCHGSAASSPGCAKLAAGRQAGPGERGPTCTPRSPRMPTRCPSVRQMALMRRSGQFFRMEKMEPLSSRERYMARGMLQESARRAGWGLSGRGHTAPAARLNTGMLRQCSNLLPAGRQAGQHPLIAGCVPTLVHPSPGCAVQDAGRCRATAGAHAAALRARRIPAMRRRTLQPHLRNMRLYPWQYCPMVGCSMMGSSSSMCCGAQAGGWVGGWGPACQQRGEQALQRCQITTAYRMPGLETNGEVASAPHSHQGQAQQPAWVQPAGPTAHSRFWLPITVQGGGSASLWRPRCAPR